MTQPDTASAASIEAATRRAIALLSLATFSSMVSQRICDPMLPELSREFGVPLAVAAQVVSMFAVVYGVSQLFYGPMGDRLGKFRVVTWTTLGCGVASVGAVLAPTLDALVLARMGVALGAGAIIPLALAWTGDAVPYARRQETLARLGLGTTLGLVAGQVAGGVLTDALGWRWAFAFMAALYCASGALLWRQLRSVGAMQAASSVAVDTLRIGAVAQARQILAGSWPRTVVLVALIEGAVGFGVLAIWPTHLNQHHGLSLSASGAIVALYGVGAVLYMLTARHWIPRLGERGLTLLGTSSVAACALLFVLTPAWWLTPFAALLAGFGFFMFHNTMQANATQMAPHARGTGVSMFAAALFTGQSLGVLGATQLAQRIDTGPVIAIGGLSLLALGGFFAWRLRHRGH